MTRRALLGVLVGLAAFLAFGCSGPEAVPEEESPATPPNIIFVLADDLDYASVQEMPALHSLLVEEGTSFDNAFINYPTCCPSRATILTGLYVHNHDVRGNGPPSGGFQKFRAEGHEEDTVAVRLQEEGGYQTAFFGKYMNGYPEENDATHVPPGWDEWYAKERGQRLYDYDINENGEVVSYGNEAEDFYTDVLSGQATDFVRRAAPDPRPFFAYVAPTAPHGPATPAERHEGAFADAEISHPPSFDEEDLSDKPSLISEAERISEEDASNIDDFYRQRLESMLAVDEMVASLVEELEAAGELDDTFIFFTSDNGLLQGEHRISFSKSYPYEESVRVPLFVRGPGVPSGSKVDKLVLNTDFAPTFAELAGAVEFPADGRSLAPLLRGEGTPPWRSAVLLEKPSTSEDQEGSDGEGSSKGEKGEEGGEKEDSNDKAPRCKGKSGDRFRAKCQTRQGPGRLPAYEAVRTETHKYVEYESGEKELYDLQADPYELESLHESADPSLVEDLKTRLEALGSCAGEGCREAEGP